eukprot:TRINITY_DN73813_c0_g1_i1.p1 TRINITY_DN73813_c0_g1~~TRINITY_DN73813_c0_g1_i1.p1  ORF type:complete len:424 (+),score=48.76 TRINITY_DN73813_c0_g1_i1:35-1306(+)
MAMIMYHGCSQATAHSIQREGFRPSAGGELGAGVYMVDKDNIDKAKRFAHDEFHRAKGSQWESLKNEPVLLECLVDIPRRGYHHEGWHDNFDAVYADHTSKSKSPEWCVADPSKIKLKNIIQLVGCGCPWGGEKWCPYEQRISQQKAMHSPWGGTCPCKKKGLDFVLPNSDEYSPSADKGSHGMDFIDTDGDKNTLVKLPGRVKLIINDGEHVYEHITNITVKPQRSGAARLTYHPEAGVSSIPGPHGVAKAEYILSYFGFAQDPVEIVEFIDTDGDKNQITKTRGKLKLVINEGAIVHPISDIALCPNDRGDVTLDFHPKAGHSTIPGPNAMSRANKILMFCDLMVEFMDTDGDKNQIKKQDDRIVLVINGGTFVKRISGIKVQELADGSVTLYFEPRAGASTIPGPGGMVRAHEILKFCDF